MFRQKAEEHPRVLKAKLNTPCLYIHMDSRLALPVADVLWAMFMVSVIVTGAYGRC